MARLLSVRTLARAPPLAAALLLNCWGGRRLSGFPERTQLAGLEVEAEGGSAPLAEIKISRLEDAIHAMIVRLSTPDWLPFVPGSSYWVLPRERVAELISGVGNPVTAEEIMSFTSVHGWPSLAYFVEGASPRSLLVTQERTDAESDNEEC